MTEREDRRRFASRSLWAAVVALIAGLLALQWYRGQHPARGYTALGLILGILSTVLFVGALVYTWRKRAGQERLPGNLEDWLWSHGVISFLAIGLALLHSGPHLDGTSGTWALVVAVFSVVSGVIGWGLYRRVPPTVAAEVGNLSARATENELKAIAGQIAEAQAGRSSNFNQRAASLISSGVPDKSGLNQAEVAALGQLGSLLTRQRQLNHLLQRQQHLRLIMRGWLWLHIPMSLSIVFFLVFHIYNALDVHYAVFKPHAADFASPEACKSCHPRQYSEWIGSMHAIAQSSPVTDLQTRLDLEKEQADLQQGVSHTAVGDLCERCHAPTGTAASPSEHKFPLIEVNDRASASAFGVSCVACHQISSIIAPVDAVNVSFSDLPLRNASKLTWHPGHNMNGPFGGGEREDAAAIGNSFHHATKVEDFTDPRFCASCHSVAVDSPKQFTLQTTYYEWLGVGEDQANAIQWSEAPEVHCLACHGRDLSDVVHQVEEMRVNRVPLEDRRARIREIIEANTLPTRDYAAINDGSFDRPPPRRAAYSHTFTGVDYHLEPDLPYPRDNPLSAGNAQIQHDNVCRVSNLLRIAAAVQIGRWGGEPDLKVNVLSLATGHHFPAGFAFAREAWLEVGVSVSQQGDNFQVVVGGGEDLKPLSPTQGLDTSDPGLHNFQAVLFDETKNRPTVLQNEATTVLAKKAQLVKNNFTDREQFLRPGEIRSLRIPLPLDTNDLARVQRIRVRLRFRNYPPSFLKELADRFRALPILDEERAQRAEALIDHLKIFEITEDTIGREDAPAIPALRIQPLGCD